MIQRNLTKATKGLNTAIEQLTTGYKLNHAKDNPANWAMMKGMETKLRAWSVAEDNIMMSSNMLETASSSADLIANHITRIRDLCQQASNGTYGEDSVKAIKAEVGARLEEIRRIKDCTEFNDIKLFGDSDSEGKTMAKTFNLQIGIDGSESSRITVDTALYLDDVNSFEDLDITDSSTLDVIDGMLDTISDYQVKIGASQNRLDSAIEYAEVMSTNLTSSISTIRDADVAEASSDFIKYQILQQACVTLLATANQQPAMALQLL